MKTEMIMMIGGALVLSPALALAQEAAPNSRGAPVSCTQPTCEEKDAACGPAWTAYRTCTSRSPGVWVTHVTEPTALHDPKTKAPLTNDGSQPRSATATAQPTSVSPASIAGARAAIPGGRGSNGAGAGAGPGSMSIGGRTGAARSPAGPGGSAKH